MSPRLVPTCALRGAALWLLTTALATAAPAQFTPVPAASADLGVLASAGVEWDGVAHPLAWTELIHVGDRPGGTGPRFGTLADHTGRVGASPMRPPYADLCNEADYNGVLVGPAGPQLITHFECPRGGLYRSSLVVEDRSIRVSQTRYDGPLEGIGGGYNPCAGQITPWGTMLSSEEYEPNARSWDATSGLIRSPDGQGGWTDDPHYSRLASAFPDLRDTWPYRYGWIPEVDDTGADGSLSGSRHYSMGRFSHEMAYVLPDRRTVYLSDDGWSSVGWAMFVADTAGDLSAGTLYAAQWTTTSETGGPVQWISLGHATDDELAPWVERKGAIAFSDLLVAATPDDDGRCPEGLERVRTAGRTECLAFAAATAAVPRPELLASRLETRRAAALKGASIEFVKGEGVAWDASRGRVLMALSSISQEMEAGETTGPDTVRLPSNPCGAVVAGDTAAGVVDTDGAPILSAHVATNLHIVLAGIPEQQGCSNAGITNPDNIVYDDTLDMLFVGEDTHKQPRPSLWGWRPGDPAPTRLLLAPPHAEVTGLHITQALGGHELRGEPGDRWLLVSVQHPWAERYPSSVPPFDVQLEGTAHGTRAKDQRSFVGALGPLPRPAPPAR